MLLPLQSLQVLLGRLCWQMLAHPQSVHLLLSRLCSQMPAPPQSCTCSSRDYLRTSACPLRSAHSLPLPPSYLLDPRLPLHDRIIGLLPRLVAISPCHDKRSGVPGFTTAFSSSLPTPFCIRRCAYCVQRQRDQRDPLVYAQRTKESPYKLRQFARNALVFRSLLVHARFRPSLGDDDVFYLFLLFSTPSNISSPCMSR